MTKVVISLKTENFKYVHSDVLRNIKLLLLLELDFGFVTLQDLKNLSCGIDLSMFQEDWIFNFNKQK